MDHARIADELKSLILERDLSSIRRLLHSVVREDSITRIGKAFEAGDPVVFAIEKSEEDIAIYLIEKGFSTTLLHESALSSCDYWCKQQHQTDRCPSQLDALILARRKHLTRAAQLIMDIRDGVRCPGDGLEIGAKPVKVTQGYTKKEQVSDVKEGVNGTSKSPSTKPCTSAALDLIEKHGVEYRSENGSTLLHKHLKMGDGLVYVAAENGVQINAQDFNGNTALHLAIGLNDLRIVRALLSVGADLSIRNKLGQLPTDMVESKEMSNLVDMYKPGLLKALQNQNVQHVNRLIKLWCSIDSNILDGSSALDIAKDTQAMKILKTLQENRLKLSFIHAVLSGNSEKLKEIVNDRRCHQWINLRYGCKGMTGPTLLSCAIENGNLDIIKILLATNKCVLSVRVPEITEIQSSPSVPLYFKTLEPDCPTEIWKYVSKFVELSEDFEKDCNGNTPLLRAIQNGKSHDFMVTLFKDLSLNRLLTRNGAGQTARDLAFSRGRMDIVSLIDTTIFKSCGEGMLHSLPSSFYNPDHVTAIRDEDGNSLMDMAISTDCRSDIQSLSHWADIELFGCQLFKAAAVGDIETIRKLNTTDYTDQNGYTALIRAIVFNQPKVAEELLIHRPELRLIGDNLNRYPLHYAYALPEEESHTMVSIILSQAQEGIEKRRDKDGRVAAEYKQLRGSPYVVRMLYDACSKDPYGRRDEDILPSPLKDMLNTQCDV